MSWYYLFFINSKKRVKNETIEYLYRYEIDILLSWNYRHLANIFKKGEIQIVNLEEGYDKPLELITPLEVINEDNY